MEHSEKALNCTFRAIYCTLNIFIGNHSTFFISLYREKCSLYLTIYSSPIKIHFPRWHSTTELENQSHHSLLIFGKKYANLTQNRIPFSLSLPIAPNQIYFIGRVSGKGCYKRPSWVVYKKVHVDARFEAGSTMQKE